METIWFTATEDTPDIILNPESKFIEIAGRSFPENANNLYNPVIEWIEKYFAENNSDSLTINFKLEYFNSASSKKIMQILFNLEKYYTEGATIKIAWFYKIEDAVMLTKAQEVLFAVTIPYVIKAS